MLPRRVATLLVTAAAVVALAAPAGAEAGAQSAACPGADLVPDASNLAQVGQATLCLLNDERAERGLRPVRLTPRLTAPSVAYSGRMVAEDFFAHVSPEGDSLVDRLTAARYIERNGDWTVGENIAWGQGDLATPRNIMIAWMNSPGHRANILTAEYREIGIGVVLGAPGSPTWGATYTTDFGDVLREPVARRKPAHRSCSARAARSRASRARAARSTGRATPRRVNARKARTASCARTASARRSRR